MNANSNKLRLYILIAFVLTAASVALRVFALFSRFDYVSGYYVSSPIVTAAYILPVVAVLLSLVLMYTLKQESLKATFYSPATFLPSGIVGVALVPFAISLFKIGKSFLRTRSAYEILAFSTALLALLSICHFLLTALLTERRDFIRAYFAIATISMLAIYASVLYFDTSTPLNAPNKIIDQMAILFASIFFLYEARISLGREMWRAYSGFGLAAFALLSYSAIPTIIIYFAKGTLISASLEAAMLALALALFIFLRVCLVSFMYADGECRAAKIVREHAQQLLDEARDEQEKLERDEMQLTIDDILTTDSESEPETKEGSPEEIDKA